MSRQILMLWWVALERGLTFDEPKARDMPYGHVASLRLAKSQSFNICTGNLRRGWGGSQGTDWLLADEVRSTKLVRVNQPKSDEKSEICQNLPQSANICQNLPNSAKISQKIQNLSKYAKIFQIQPKSPKLCQTQAKSAEICWNQPKSAEISQNLLKSPKICWNQPKSA